MSNELSDLIAQLNRDGFEALVNPNYGTIDITRVNGSPLLDPWPLLLDPARLQRVLALLRTQLGQRTSTKDVIQDLAHRIESDVKTYAPSEGPFALDDQGYAIRTTLG